MGKLTGFIEWPRTPAPKRSVTERVGDFREVPLRMPPEEAKRQAGRCMDCGVPFCHQGCPLGNPIPDFNDLVWKDRWAEAFAALDSTNDFPDFTGRLCPAPCEAACVLAIDRDPVTIENLEKEIIERAFAEGWVTPRTRRPRTGKRVAVVGSGPAGLAGARALNVAGHEATVFERADRVGGLLRYGIPDFKMEKWVLDRRLAVLEAEGVRFRTGVDVGKEPSWRALRDEFDAVLIATGARAARELDLPGRSLSGVVPAMDFLEHQNRASADGSALDPSLDARGKKVVILGGGDTGSDCLGTAHRQGASAVTQVELFPAPPPERAEDNPWPQWPLVFRTSSSQEEGGGRSFALKTVRLEGEGGRLRALHAVKVEALREEGRVRLVEQAGSETVLEVDLLLLALGFVGPEQAELRDQLGVGFDGRGNVALDEGFRTSVPGVFAAGDAHKGASLIVWAISEGREAARAIDAFLRAGESALPTRGVDRPFGGR